MTYATKIVAAIRQSCYSPLSNDNIFANLFAGGIASARIENRTYAIIKVQAFKDIDILTECAFWTIGVVFRRITIFVRIQPITAAVKVATIWFDLKTTNANQYWHVKTKTP